MENDIVVDDILDSVEKIGTKDKFIINNTIDSSVLNNKADKAALDAKVDKGDLEGAIGALKADVINLKEQIKNKVDGSVYEFNAKITEKELDKRVTLSDVESIINKNTSKYALRTDIPKIETIDKSQFATREDLRHKADVEDLETKADRSDLIDVVRVPQLEGLAKAADLELYAKAENLKSYALKTDLYDLATKEDLKKKANAEDLSNYATREEVAKKLDRSEMLDYALKSEIPNAKLFATVNELEKKVNRDELDVYVKKSEIVNKVDRDELKTLATKDELNNKANKTDLERLATKDALYGKVDVKELDKYATRAELDNKVDKLEAAKFATKDEVAGKLCKEEAAKFATKCELNNKANKEELSKYALREEVDEIRKFDPYELKKLSHRVDEVINFASELDNVLYKKDLEEAKAKLASISELTKLDFKLGESKKELAAEIDKINDTVDHIKLQLEDKNAANAALLKTEIAKVQNALEAKIETNGINDDVLAKKVDAAIATSSEIVARTATEAAKNVKNLETKLNNYIELGKTVDEENKKKIADKADFSDLQLAKDELLKLIQANGVDDVTLKHRVDAIVRDIAKSEGFNIETINNLKTDINVKADSEVVDKLIEAAKLLLIKKIEDNNASTLNDAKLYADNAVKAANTQSDSNIADKIDTVNSTIASNKADIEGKIDTVNSTIASNKADIEGKLTNAKAELTSAIDANKKANEAAVASAKSELTSNVTTINNTLDGKIATNKAELEGKITAVDGKLDAYVSKNDAVISKVAEESAAGINKINGLQEIVNNNKAELDSKINANTEAQKLLATKEELEAGYVSKQDLKDYASKRDIDVISKLETKEVVATKADQSAVDAMKVELQGKIDTKAASSDVDVLRSAVAELQGKDLDTPMIEIADSKIAPINKSIGEIKDTLATKADITLVDTKADKTALENYATKVDIADKVSTEELNGVKETVQGNTENIAKKADKTAVDAAVEQAKQEAASALNAKASEITLDIDNKVGAAKSEASEALNAAKSELTAKIDEKIAAIPPVDLSGYYQKTEVYNKDEVDAKIGEKIAAIPAVDLSPYATTAQVTGLTETLNSEIARIDNKATEAINSAISGVEGKITALESKVDTNDAKLADYYKNNEVDAKLADIYNKTDVYNKSEIDSKLTDVYNKSEVESKIDEKIAAIPAAEPTATADLSNYYNKEEVDAAIKAAIPPEVEVTAGVDVSNFVTKSEFEEYKSTAGAGGGDAETLTLQQILDGVQAGFEQGGKLVPVFDSFAKALGFENLEALKTKLNTPAQ